ncbi:hypothetical protein ACFX11_043556 [Malus domestica]
MAWWEATKKPVFSWQQILLNPERCRTIDFTPPSQVRNSIGLSNPTLLGFWVNMLLKMVGYILPIHLTLSSFSFPFLKLG